MLTWLFVLTVCCGLALLSGQGLGSRSHPAASGATAAVSSAGPDAAGQVLAAPYPPRGGAVSASPVSTCPTYRESRDFLPLNRWTSFSLFTVDNAWILKTRLFTSMIAGLLFMAAALIWRLIGMLMGFGYTFDMICPEAGPINTATHAISVWASWFLIPLWLFVLAAVIKRWSAGGRDGPASAMRLLMVFLSATGLIFFIADQSSKHENDPTAAYTVPWMAASVQSWFAVASSSLTSLPDLGVDGATAFYDTDSDAAGKVTCAKLDTALYHKYATDNRNTGMGSGVGGMEQVSKIWEITLVRSWMAAQFGDGSPMYPSPAHAACRDLEANSDVDVSEKLKAYDLATGNKPGTTRSDTWRGYFIAPPSGEQTIMVAWGACQGDDNGRGSDRPIKQWDLGSSMSDKAKACAKLYSGDRAADMSNVMKFLLQGGGKVDAFYFNGGDELNDKLGDCIASADKDIAEACRFNWNFVSGWLGANQAERLTQGLMSLVVAAVFLFVLGPLAFGLTLISVALAGLAMILPLTLLLFAAGMDQGKKLLKLTGAAAGGKFIFTFALTFLVLLISVADSAVLKSVATPTPNFFEQVLEAAAPLAALFLFKKIAKLMGLGDISKMTGALGFAGAAALKSTGDRDLSRGAAERMSGALGRLGVGKARLGALDERSLQRRMLNNKATRAAGSAAKKAAGWATRPARDWGKTKYEASRDALRKKKNEFLQNSLANIKEGSPAQRAAGFAALTAMMAGITAVAPPAVLATLPMMAATGAAALGETARHARDRLKNAIGLWSLASGGSSADGALKEGDAAGIVMAKDHRTVRRHADYHHKNVIRVNDPSERRAVTTEYVKEGLDKSRSVQWGANSLDGLNTGFRGFANARERTVAVSEMASKMGVAPEDIMVSNQGLAIPKPAFVDVRTGQRVFPADANLDYITHPVHYMDRYTLRRQKVNGVEENDDQYVARLAAQLRERGFVGDNGEVVDVFAANDLDTRVPAIRERVTAFAAGARDEELSAIRVVARRSEDAGVWASRQWVLEQGSNQLITDRRERAVSDALTSARQHLDLDGVQVHRPNGDAVRFDELRGELHQELDILKNVIARTRSVYERQDSLDRREFQTMVDELRTLQQARTHEINRMAEELRDALDATLEARGACGIESVLVDPNTSMNFHELETMARQVQESTRQQRQSLHDELEAPIGALSRIPTSEEQAGRLAKLLDEFKERFEERVAEEKRSNREVEDDLEDFNTRMQHWRNQVTTGLRDAQNGPDSIRDMLDLMNRRELSRN